MPSLMGKSSYLVFLHTRFAATSSLMIFSEKQKNKNKKIIKTTHMKTINRKHFYFPFLNEYLEPI